MTRRRKWKKKEWKRDLFFVHSNAEKSVGGNENKDSGEKSKATRHHKRFIEERKKQKQKRKNSVFFSYSFFFRNMALIITIKIISKMLLKIKDIRYKQEKKEEKRRVKNYSKKRKIGKKKKKNKIVIITLWSVF